MILFFYTALKQGIDPLEYPQNYKDALMKLDNIEKIKKFVKENENG